MKKWTIVKLLYNHVFDITIDQNRLAKPNTIEVIDELFEEGFEGTSGLTIHQSQMDRKHSKISVPTSEAQDDLENSGW